jgi:TonB family protein
MGYQALLFCPDEKTAHTVTQVLSELDFAVTPCTEPFAAVKKLMGEHFDAVVVDCDNEQNATLLFKSARNTSSNQSSLAVAVVEGQAGVAKAFRIGANLVLTKPINVEQAKGTLRVARGLLRKNEVAKPAPTANPAPLAPPVPKPVPQPTTLSNDADVPPMPVSPVVAAKANIETQKQASATAVLSQNNPDPSLAAATVKTRSSESTKLPAAQTPASETIASLSKPKIEAPVVHAALGTSAASAPAPAREPKSDAQTENKVPAVVPETKTPTIKDFKEGTVSAEASSSSAPMFTFGGTVNTETESGSSGSKKWVLVIAAMVVLIAAGGYFAWMHWGQSNDSSTVPGRAVEAPVKASAPIPQAVASPALTPSDKASAPDTAIPASPEIIETHPDTITSEVVSSKSSPSTTNKAPAAKEAEAPIVLKHHLSSPAPKSVANNDAPAPPMLSGVAPSGNGGRLPNLMESHSNAPAPVLQTLNVSQGVSQGLLIKKVQPKYPPNALRARIEGSVQLLATISKDGDISAVKILSGDAQLSHAAADTVKQWKYKPYLLNGSPVEIQTQITVNFKVPN